MILSLIEYVRWIWGRQALWAAVRILLFVLGFYLISLLFNHGQIP